MADKTLLEKLNMSLAMTKLAEHKLKEQKEKHKELLEYIKNETTETLIALDLGSFLNVMDKVVERWIEKENIVGTLASEFSVSPNCDELVALYTVLKHNGSFPTHNQKQVPFYDKHKIKKGDSNA